MNFLIIKDCYFAAITADAIEFSFTSTESALDARMQGTLERAVAYATLDLAAVAHLCKHCTLYAGGH